MSNELWKENSVQFPRLIAEIVAAGVPDACWEEVVNSMDITYEELNELQDRAQEEWESIKNRHCPPIKTAEKGYKKKVFQYNDGQYYVWNGESLSGGVIHKTRSKWNAADFSGYLNEEDALSDIPEYDGGRFVILK